jgi:hypothetical protein
MPNKIFYTFFNSPLGKIGIASSPFGVVCVNIGVKENTFLEKLKRKFPEYKLVKSEKRTVKQ